MKTVGHGYGAGRECRVGKSSAAWVTDSSTTPTACFEFENLQTRPCHPYSVHLLHARAKRRNGVEC